MTAQKALCAAVEVIWEHSHLDTCLWAGLCLLEMTRGPSKLLAAGAVPYLSLPAARCCPSLLLHKGADAGDCISARVRSEVTCTHWQLFCSAKLNEEIPLIAAVLRQPRQSSARSAEAHRQRSQLCSRRGHGSCPVLLGPLVNFCTDLSVLPIQRGECVSCYCNSALKSSSSTDALLFFFLFSPHPVSLHFLHEAFSQAGKHIFSMPVLCFNHNSVCVWMCTVPRVTWHWNC